jgi:hypothetical protein
MWLHNTAVHCKGTPTEPGTTEPRTTKPGTTSLRMHATKPRKTNPGMNQPRRQPSLEHKSFIKENFFTIESPLMSKAGNHRDF